MKMKQIFSFTLLCIFFISLKAQNQSVSITINWETATLLTDITGKEVPRYFFDGAYYVDEYTNAPKFSHLIVAPRGYTFENVQITNLDFDGLDDVSRRFRSELTPQTGKYVSYYISKSRGQNLLNIDMELFQLVGEQLNKLVRFDVSYNLQREKNTSNKSYKTKLNSVLASGTWYKFGITENSLVKIDKNYLNSIGINVKSINPNLIRIYGNGGGMLPKQNSAIRADDLLENAIYTHGFEDGTFDDNDYFLFYAQGPHTWNLQGETFRHAYNIYSDTSFYFLTYDGGSGSPSRITSAVSLSSPQQNVVSFDDYDFHEKDLYNLIKSGSKWYGEQFGIVLSQSFPFSFPNVDGSQEGEVRVNVASRTLSTGATFSCSVGSWGNASVSIPNTVAGYATDYAFERSMSFKINPSTASFNVLLSYDKGLNTNATGWLDFIEVQVRRNLVYANSPLFFRDLKSLNKGIAQYQISNGNSALLVWDITNINKPVEQQYSLVSGKILFNQITDSLKTYVVFNPNDIIKTPESAYRVDNQNLHSMGFADLLIVTHENFRSEAENLGQFHQDNDNLSYHVVTCPEIYNEFSSGAQDITAIRDFVRMLYTRANGDTALMPRYLMLFGDASFDYKDRYNGNTNYVPAYESQNSVQPTASYVSDDFYGFMDDTESEAISDVADIGIGRLPVKSKLQAVNAINKIEGYYDTRTMGPWRNTLVFVADDDENIKTTIHMSDANQLATLVDTQFCNFNIDKIFVDAYKKISTSGADRYPDVNEAINRRMEKGALVFNYVGHGGELGLAHERIVEVDQINDWSNTNNLPLFVTATCEFTRFDDPLRTSAGEFVFLNPTGGGIGLLTTTRLVYSTPNYQLAKAFNDYAYDVALGTRPTLGDLNRLTKANSPKNINSRCFSLIGDPALSLAYPEYKVITTSVSDTLKAMDKVTVAGYVADENGNKLTDFNGILFPTIFDKSKQIVTLDNNGWGPFNFNLQSKVIFNGRASIKNGDFNFEFIVPKDISYEYGTSRFSYYGENGIDDASGCYEEAIIGGISDNPIVDNTGPAIKLYMNNDQFISGGLTDQNPFLLANIFDENGINTVGNGIGHDIVAVLDGNTANSIVLNDYYKAELDSYQKGTIKYAFKDLALGNHTLSLKVWDALNNSSESQIDFVVANDEELTLYNVLNYPNPFTTSTSFYFEHNYPSQNMFVRVQVFSVAGNLVKTIDGYHLSDGFRIGPINWNGKDEFGDRIGKGTYIYKVEVTAPNGKTVNKFEKLVILN